MSTIDALFLKVIRMNNEKRNQRERENYRKNREQVLEYRRKKYHEKYKNDPNYKQRRKESWKKWYSKNKERQVEYNRQYRKNNYDKELIRQRKYNQEHREERNAKRRERNAERRLRVIQHYSNGTNSCSCCGESIVQFLTVEHINGGGTKHREEQKLYGNTFYYWLIKNKFPLGYEILCYNCNCAKGAYGICPHK